MSQSRIPDNAWRCWDHECPERETCARWLERRDGGRWAVSAKSLRRVVNGACENRIPAGSTPT